MYDGKLFNTYKLATANLLSPELFGVQG